MTRKPRIAFFVHTPLRDLPGTVLTAYELCQRGADCFIVEQKDGFGEIWAIAPDFVMLPAFREYYAPRVQQYAEAGILFGLSDSEGVIWSSMEEYRNTLWKDGTLSKKASCVCMWGKTPADYVVANDIFESKQVFVTGCPRFDFYSGSHSSIYPVSLENNRGEKNGKLNRKYILINTNFTNGNYSDLPLDVHAERYAANYGGNLDDVLRMCRKDRKAVEAVSEMACRLAADFPDIDIIIRPHPQEHTAPYQENIQKISNLYVERSGSVTPWILNASVVIQRSCTTAVEATLAGIPAISPQWIGFSQYYPIPESVSIQSPDYDHLKATLKSILAGDFQMPAEIETNLKSLISEWFHKNDGLSHKRVAEAILSTLSSKSRLDRKKCIKFLYGLNKLRPIRKGSFGNILRYGLGLSTNWTLPQFRQPNGSKEKHQSQRLEWISELVKGITAAKVDENPKQVNISSAREHSDYTPRDYSGGTIVMYCD